MINTLHAFALTTYFALLAGAETTQNPYCNLKTCNGPKHTLCKYPLLKTSKQCGKIVSSALTAGEIQELLNVHNKYRPLQWDQELADIAQTWADQCTPRLDECRNVERFRVAQSYSFRRSTDPLKVELSQLVNKNPVTKETAYVGCGAIRYNPNGQWNSIYLVCNYANGGK